jgi:hypothetical protein
MKTVVSTDYALEEYGLTPKEMEVAERRILAELKTARANGELTPFTIKPKSVRARLRRAVTFSHEIEFGFD